MFGIGFFELLVIAVLGLLVFGPEKLPEAIRTFAFGLSKAKRSWQNTRRELEQELGMDEIRREIHNAEILESIEKTKTLNLEDIGSEQDQTENISPDLGQHIDTETDASDSLETTSESEPPTGSQNGKKSS